MTRTRDARVTGITQRKEAMMATGTVKFFNTQKGFGFIQPSDGSKDVFVHISAVERAGMRTLVEGQKVSYDVVTERGKQAAGNLRAE
jgi:CspA family cold shock protein